MDNVFTESVITDLNGNWQADYPQLVNGPHNILAEIASVSLPTTSDTKTFFSMSEIFLPQSMSQLNIIAGHIPTSAPGSGVGNGYTYNVAGTTATISFTQSFYSTPVITSTGQYSSGPSTITISGASTTGATLEFATADFIHFVVQEFL